MIEAENERVLPTSSICVPNTNLSPSFGKDKRAKDCRGKSRIWKMFSRPILKAIWELRSLTSEGHRGPVGASAAGMIWRRMERRRSKHKQLAREFLPRREGRAIQLRLRESGGLVFWNCTIQTRASVRTSLDWSQGMCSFLGLS